MAQVANGDSALVSALDAELHNAQEVQNYSYTSRDDKVCSEYVMYVGLILFESL